MKIVYKDDTTLLLEEKPTGILVIAGVSLGLLFGVTKHYYFEDPELFLVVVCTLV